MIPGIKAVIVLILGDCHSGLWDEESSIFGEGRRRRCSGFALPSANACEPSVLRSSHAYGGLALDGADFLTDPTADAYVINDSKAIDGSGPKLGLNLIGDYDDRFALVFFVSCRAVLLAGFAVEIVGPLGVVGPAIECSPGDTFVSVKTCFADDEFLFELDARLLGFGEASQGARRANIGARGAVELAVTDSGNQRGRPQALYTFLEKKGLKAVCRTDLHALSAANAAAEEIGLVRCAAFFRLIDA